MTTSDRVPPCDLDAEAAVLSDVILRATTSEVADTLKPEHFYSSSNRRIYHACLELEARGDKLDLVTIAGWLRERGDLDRSGGISYMVQIADATPAVDNVGAHAAIVVGKARLRSLIATAQRIAAEGYGTTTEQTQAFIDRAEQDVFAIAQERTIRGPQRAKDILREHYTDIQKRLETKTARRVKTGLTKLDELLVGLDDGNLALLAARPGVGKTALAAGIARNVARTGAGAAVFSLEMTREELIDRLICAEARIDSRKLAHNDLTFEEWQRAAAAAAEIAKLPLWIDDEPAISLTALRAKARRIAAELGREGRELRLVVVDYLQLMGVNPKLNSREQQVAENSRGLKALAKDLRVPVLALSQLNRDVTKRGKAAKPTLSDLRESGSLEQDADFVLFIHVPEDRPGVAEIIVGKGRSFGTGSARVAWQKRFCRFDDLAEGEGETFVPDDVDEPEREDW